MTTRYLQLLLLALAPLWPGGAFAEIVTLSGCASCNGGTYSLSYDGQALPDSDPAHETFRITLSIDTSGVPAAVAGAVALDTASIKIAPAVRGGLLVSAPGGLSQWQLLGGGADSNGCKGQGGGGYVCADWIGSGVGTALGGVLDFVFDLTVDNGALFTDLDEPHVKARYVDASGGKVGAVLSNDLTLGTPPRLPTDLPTDVPTDLPHDTPPGASVPEPAAWLLVLTAMAGFICRPGRRARPVRPL